MNSFFKEVLIFQNLLGVNESFDFITGRDFKMYNCINDKQKIEVSTNNKTGNKKINNNVSNENTDIDNSSVEFDEINDTDKIKKTTNAEDDNNNNDYLNNINSFDELVEKIRNFNNCDLKRYATNTVIFDGNKNSKIMLIGEAPGESEDLEGRPFCGQSGKLLRKALSYIQLDNSNLIITNTVFWRPPLNRKPYEDEIAVCLPFVKKMIDIVKPEIIILCGSTAIEAILKSKKRMSEVTGKIIDTKINELNIKIFPIYHPSYLLRSPSIKKVFWEHLVFLKKMISNPS